MGLLKMSKADNILVKMRNYVGKNYDTQSGNCKNLLTPCFAKIMRKQRYHSSCCFHENIFEMGVNSFFSTVWQHCKIPIGIFRSIEDVNK